MGLQVIRVNISSIADYSHSRGHLLSNNLIGNSAVQDIIVGSTIFGNIGKDDSFVIGAADIDLYRFTPTASSTVNIQTQALQAFSADTFLRIFDVNGAQIAANDNQDSTTRGSFVQISVTAGTTYYVGVNGASAEASNYDPFTGAGASDGSQGDYVLQVTSTPVETSSTVLIPDSAAASPDLTSNPVSAALTLDNAFSGDIVLPDSANSQITGNAESDDLSGSSSQSSLIGGEEAKRFNFSGLKRKAEQISDFSVQFDTIVVSARGFGGGLSADRTLRKSQFQVGSQARDRSDRFIYNSRSGGLFFDVDGLGGARQTRFATLSPNLLLTHRDIFVS